jgi:hypothetical protein
MATERGLLRGMLERRIIGFGGPALPGQFPGGIDVGKIGSDGLAVAIDQVVRYRDPAGHRDRADDEQDQAVAPHACDG